MPALQVELVCTELRVMDVRLHMLSLDSDHVKGLDKPTEYQEFHEMYVKQVKKARDSVFIEICNEIGQGYDHRSIAARYLRAKKTVNKEKLSNWVETLAHILDMYCIPWLQKAAPLAEEVRNLRCEIQTCKAENTAQQNRIVDLQNQLIKKQEEQLNSVKSLVETEMKIHSAAVKSTVAANMKSYSEAVSETCSTALTSKKLHAAVQKASEKEARSRNVIIYGLEEKPNELLVKQVDEVLCEIGEKPLIKNCCRVGHRKNNSTRPVKFSLNSSAGVIQIMKKARKLRSKDGYKFIYICPDRSYEERKSYRKLVDESF